MNMKYPKETTDTSMAQKLALNLSGQPQHTHSLISPIGGLSIPTYSEARGLQLSPKKAELEQGFGNPKPCSKGPTRVR